MTLRAVIRKGGTVRQWYSEYGFFRAVGNVAKYCGDTTFDFCNAVATIRKRNRGSGFSIGTRLNAARNGFSAHSYRWLGLDEKDCSRYLSSPTPFWRTSTRYSDLIDDKYVFQKYTEPYVDRIPRLHGVVDDGEYEPRSGDRSADGLLDALERSGKLVLKPMIGSEGYGIHVLEVVTDGFVLDGTLTSASDISALESQLDDYLVMEFVQQHDYATAIFPDALNTLRVFSIIDPETDTPSVFRAAHRFGSTQSAPTDNWSRGGFAAHVDTETGEIGGLVVLDSDRRRTELERHPDTGVRVRGTSVPHWDDVCELIRELAAHHSHTPFVGWDVAVSDGGPVVIEGNSTPGIRLLQIENGFFEDARARRLFGET